MSVVEIPTAGSLRPHPLDMHKAMEVLHDPWFHQLSRIFRLDVPLARLTIRGAAHGAASTITPEIFAETEYEDFANAEWNRTYNAAFNGYRAGAAAGYLLAKRVLGE